MKILPVNIYNKNNFSAVNQPQLLFGIKNERIKRGSITAEAALVFPVFFFFFVILLGFFQVMLLRMEVQNAVFDTASFVSQYAYLEEMISGKGDAEKKSFAYEGKISDFVEGVLDHTLIKIKFDSIR